MKYRLSLLLFVIAMTSALAQTPAPETLNDFVREYEQTWQSHDAAQLAEFFADDADMIFGIEPVIAGRAPIRNWWELYFSRLDDGRNISIAVVSTRMLGPDVALLNVETTTGGTHSATNAPLESRKARGTWVVTRNEGSWRISALRAHSPVGEFRAVPGMDQ